MWEGVVYCVSLQAYDPDPNEERLACLLEQSINVNKLLVCLYLALICF